MSNLLGGLKGITYRVELVDVVDPGSSKQSIQDAVTGIHDRIVKQLENWHAGGAGE
jgi:hypothetical protein